MKILYKISIFIFLLFISNSAFAQLQKGDVWLDFSPQQFQEKNKPEFMRTFGFSSNLSSFQSRIGYGKFVGNNTLLGFRLNSSGTIGNDLFFFRQHFFDINVGLFVKHYFGQKSLRPFAETSLNTELYPGFNILNFLGIRTSEYLNFKLGGGLAYFLNEQTSLEFSYNFRPLSLATNGPQTFSKKLSPDFGIGLRYFIIKNQDGIQNLNADKTLEKGTISVGFDSNFLIGKKQNLRQSKLSIEYFIRDNFQVKAEFGFDNKKYRFRSDNILSTEQISTTFFDKENNHFGGIGILYSFRLNKTLSIDAGLGLKLIRNSNLCEDFFCTTATKTRFLEEEVSFRVGWSIYLGRHLLRPYLLFQQRSYDNNAPNTELISFNSFLFNLDYELFLAENLSMNLTVKYLPVYQQVEPIINGISSLEFSKETADFLRASFGFKWYLKRGSN